MQPSNVPPAARLAAAFAGIILETFFCGANMVVYITGTWSVLSRKYPQSLTKRDIVFLGASTSMCVLALWHWAGDLYTLVHAGITKGLDIDAFAAAFMQTGGPQGIGFAWQFIYVSQTLIADGFMIYRAFIVWRQEWAAIAAPLVMLFVEVVFGYIIVALGLRPSFPRTTYIVCRRAFFVLAVATNLLATGLILQPILISRRGAREYRPEGSALRTLRWRAMGYILQSAAIFTISSLCYMVTIFVDPVGFMICHYLFPPVVSLVFSLTVSRISLATGADSSPPRRSPFGAPGARASCPSLPLSAPATEEGEAGRAGATMRPIAIHVSVTTTRSSDRESVASFDGDSGLKEARGDSDVSGFAFLRERPC
ncbi:uncharacterized protein BXZ73DRAFT_53727 [Epithele typhae]|uniref:uncharacterized protein n=1 Tax=Epithele typhae TaxID=378194 RepID=UPI0020086028|nr:uncharacterized protein BXZ73DRAFT_53727 [Epithele typhae]KAH9916595.1 hypothetical protein BXZ73DRAFT_53727 [Epithele typhae]